MVIKINVYFNLQRLPRRAKLENENEMYVTNKQKLVVINLLHYSRIYWDVKLLLIVRPKKQTGTA